jgi:PhnB protein
MQFDFLVDKEKNTISVKRDFTTNLDLLWAAWTDSKILDQWWAPKPYKAVTERMNFSEGGQRLYYMLGPKGDKQWCQTNYQIIKIHNFFSYKEAFCDEEGIPNLDHPSMKWNISFENHGVVSSVDIEISFNSEEDLQKILKMGFQEGFIMALENLDEYFNREK